MADQRLPSPVLGDEREEPVLNLVPLAGARRQMAYLNRKAQFLGQLLQFHLPQPHPAAVAASAVRENLQTPGSGIMRLAHQPPPAADGFHGKCRRVMIYPDTHPTHIPGQIKHPVRIGPAQFRDDEVMHPHLLRLPLRTIFPACILEIPHQFLLFGVHGDDRVAKCQFLLGAPIDEKKLRIAVGVGRTLLGFAVGLQAVAQFLQQFPHQPMAHLMTTGHQLGRQPTQTLARPTQRGFGIAPCQRLNEPLQIAEQSNILGRGFFTPTPGFANPGAWGRNCRRGRGMLQFLQANGDRTPGDTRRASHQRNPTIPSNFRFGGRDQSAHALIKGPAQKGESLFNKRVGRHSIKLSFPSKSCYTYFVTVPKPYPIWRAAP